MTDAQSSPPIRFAALRYAVVWCAFAVLRALVHLPFQWQLKLGKGAGSLLCRMLPRRRRIVELNLRTCFPELPREERERMVREHFRSLGASFVEMGMGWFGSLARIRRLVRIEGIENLEAALQGGKGAILLSAHFTSFEIFFPVLAPLCPRFTGMYKEQRNPLMNKIMNRGRLRSVDRVFDKGSVRDMLKELARNSVAWYAADQSFGQKGSALVPFFNEPAMTNTAISRIAKASGATVLPYFCRRLPDDSAYVASILPPLSDFPSDDPVADTLRFNRLLEEYIRTCPDQYWWIHQRFKGRPEPYPDIYKAMTTT